jgi:hypothetical protein
LVVQSGICIHLRDLRLFALPFRETDSHEVRDTMGGVSSRETQSLYDWRVFADATCAGLSVLLPIPLLDLAFESMFRRRIPTTISRFRGVEVAPSVRRRLGAAMRNLVSLEGCLGATFAVIKYVLRRIWRKIVYIFAVKDAATALTEYWHRAALIDHMVRAGHLDRSADTGLAIRVATEVLNEIDPSPLMGLARQVVTNVQHVFGLLLAARRLGATEVTRSLGDLLSGQSQVATESLTRTTSLYNRRYRQAVQAKAAEAGGAAAVTIADDESTGV